MYPAGYEHANLCAESTATTMPFASIIIVTQIIVRH